MSAWLLEDWPLKIVSVAAAMALWLFVAKTQPSRVVVSAPVEYTGIAADRVLVGPRVERVDVELEAVRWVSARVPSRGVRARVDVAGLPDGVSVVSLSPADIEAPPGTSVTRITPARVVLTVARTVRKSASVVPETPADPAIAGMERPRSTIEKAVRSCSRRPLA